MTAKEKRAAGLGFATGGSTIAIAAVLCLWAFGWLDGGYAPRPDVITIPGVAIGGSITAAVMSVTLTIGSLVEYRHRRDKEE